MHEASLARDLVRAVLDRLPEGAHPTRVLGWVGETEALSLDSLRFHLQIATLGTSLHAAVWDLRLEHVAARCHACGATYLPEHHLTLCPTCGSPDGEVLGPTGVMVEAVEVG